jgi:hypothetical protein
MKTISLLFIRLRKRHGEVMISDTRLKQLQGSPWATDKDFTMKWDWPKGWLTKRREEIAKGCK